MVFPQNTAVPGLSGERFRVVYRIYGDDEADNMDRAAGICHEQTVELPADLVPSGEVQRRIVGQIEDAAHGDGFTTVTISYAVEAAGTGITQLLNVIFGNTSMQPGIQVRRLALSESILSAYGGPRWGRDGLRRLLGIEDERPLLSTALKPMGLSPEALADLAYKLAIGGIDIIKDDHGLANQPFCPFEARVARCAEAVANANHETGGRCLYMPNVTAPIDEVQARARFAKDAGAGGAMVSFGLTGIDAMRLLAEDETLGLPVLAHPALSGSFVTCPTSGIAHYVWYGQLMRLAGADAVIFVSYGGRFAYTEDQCRQVIEGCAAPMGHLAPIFPMPGGGMTLARIPELRRFYGRDVIFLVAGGLYRYGDDLVASTRAFAERVRQADRTG